MGRALIFGSCGWTACEDPFVGDGSRFVGLESRPTKVEWSPGPGADRVRGLRSPAEGWGSTGADGAPRVGRSRSSRRVKGVRRSDEPREVVGPYVGLRVEIGKGRGRRRGRGGGGVRGGVGGGSDGDLGRTGARSRGVVNGFSIKTPESPE